MLILYNPQSSANRKPILPFALLALGAVLEGRYAYTIVDGNLEADPVAALSARITEALTTATAPGAVPAPVVLGVTVMPGPQLQQAVPLCRELKQRFPQLIIVWGGYFPTQHWEVCLRADYVDYVVRGHGEHVFAQLLSHLHTGFPELASIAGLAYRSAPQFPPLPSAPQQGGGGSPISNLQSPITNVLAPIPHPKDLPAFPWPRVDLARYVRRTFLGTRTLGYHSSYGCPFFCNFCAVVNLVNGKWLPQSAQQIATAMQHYVEQWQVNAVEFYDNNFFVHEARVLEFAERIQPLGLRWWGEARIDTLLKFAPTTWQAMRAAGLHMIFMGAESGSLETLQRMDKGGTMSPDKTLEIARLMAQWDIVPEFSFVLGNPPDSEADTAHTLEFIRQVKRTNPRAEIILYLYTPVPLAGDLYEEARAQGFVFPHTLEEWVDPNWLNFSQRRSATMPWIKRPLQARLRDFERVLNAYYPTSTDVKISGAWRMVLRTLAAWRYHLRFYHYPLELRAVHKLIAYQRPETSGF